MLRMAQPCELASVRSGKPSIPERAPRTKELSSALERIEGDHPGLRFERPSHVLVSTPNGRAGELCVPHVCTRGFSRSSFFRLGDDVFFSKPELAFIQMATRIRNEVSLLELGWELCGSYQTRRTGASVGYDVEPLTSVRALRDYVACNSSLGGAQKVARIPSISRGRVRIVARDEIRACPGIQSFPRRLRHGLSPHELRGDRKSAARDFREEKLRSLLARSEARWSIKARRITKANSAASGIREGLTRWRPWADGGHQ